MKGPHAFPLERLLGIFWELHAATGDEAPDEAERRDLQSADVLMQISSLVSLRFLSQASSCCSLLRCPLLRAMRGSHDPPHKRATICSPVGRSAELS